MASRPIEISQVAPGGGAIGLLATSLLVPPVLFSQTMGWGRALLAGRSAPAPSFTAALDVARSAVAVSNSMPG